MSCSDLDSLQAKYKQAVDEFTETVKKRLAAQGRPKEYARLGNLAQLAKVKAEAARRALRTHIIEHGCC